MGTSIVTDAHAGIRRTLRAWLPVVEYCAEEVSRQYAYSVWAKTSAKAVGWMIDAWSYALMESARGRPLGVSLIEEIGSIVEPGHNAKGFRRIPIYVGGQEKDKPEDVQRHLLYLVDAYNEGRLEPLRWPGKTPEDQFYFEFENIHPFRDGNGRTGKIVYNMLRGTLRNPEWPPDYFGGVNP